MSAGVLSKRWFFFFFSSRRRHTRLQGDWSSDVCSSDLTPDDPAEYSVSRDGVSDGLSAPARSRPRARADTSRRLAHVIPAAVLSAPRRARDRKSTRLNSSHLVISYAVFCLKKKSMLNLLREVDQVNPKGPGEDQRLSIIRICTVGYIGTRNIHYAEILPIRQRDCFTSANSY